MTTAPKPMLADVLATISPADLVSAARTIEVLRQSTDESRLIAHHGYALSQIWTTAYAWQAGILAWRDGIIAFDRQERDFLATPAAWCHPEIQPSYYSVQKLGERVVAPALWPFAQDLPVADFDTAGARQWWSHGLVHALVGFGIWSGLSEWELMAMARLSEAVAAVHWYNLAQLGRLTLTDLPMDLSNLRGDDARRYLYAEEAATARDERLRRLDDPAAMRIAENALDTLRYEVYAYRAAMWDGDLVEPGDPLYLGLGESGDYARVHHRRLMSDAHARYREHCLVPGRDYATTAEAFEARAAAVLADLVAPAEPPAAMDNAPLERRARRVLQDVGYRICQLAACEGDSDAFARALRAVADGLGRVTADSADAAVAATLEAVAEGLGPEHGGRVLALGYQPTNVATQEPKTSVAVRAQALIDRAQRLHPAFGAALEQLRPVVMRTIAGPRSAPLVDAVAPHAEAAGWANEIGWDGYGYLGYLQVAWMAWSEKGLEPSPERWHYRIARRRMPDDPREHEAYVVAWNPYAKRTPSPFDSRWNEALIATSGRAGDAATGSRAPSVAPPKKFKSKHATSSQYVLMGAGRDGPIYVPMTPQIAALVSTLRTPHRLSQLVASRDFGAEFMRKMIAQEVVLLFHAPLVERPPRAIDLLEVAMEQAAGVEARPEPPGPWNDPEMAEAYAAYCARSRLYRDTSAALCEAAEIPRDARVADLGGGTGETSAEILARLGDEGRLVVADPAPLMVEQLMKRFADDKRVLFLGGAARVVAMFCVGQSPFDRVLANSSLTMAEDLGEELVVVARALKAGGRLAFSIPSEYLGDNEHMMTPEMVSVLGAVERARQELGTGVPETDRPLDAAFGSRENMTRALVDAGFEDVRFVRYERAWSAAEYLDWMSLPVVRRGLCAKGQEGKSVALVERIKTFVDPTLPLKSVWWMVVATRGAEAGT